ncbi:MAG: hypothetical protein E7634_01700 [Ruminococcaceae bacterium]|nr:hypothetical protein [Oscillospiraceae bacterium]
MKKTKARRFYDSLIEQVKTNKSCFAVFVALRVAIIAVLVRSIFAGRYENVFTCFLALTLFLAPPFIEKKLKIQLPTVLESIAYIFIFCAEILGEIEGFYVKFPFWDTMLHTVNGFIFAAVGFCLLDIFNRTPNVKFSLSPKFLAIVAFCFSMTIGVLWEFFEYGMDLLFQLDMQKDFFIDTIGSVKFDSSGGNTPGIITEIEKTVLYLKSGETLEFEKYLDIGLKDTMKDLFVNCIGAVVFSIVGYCYIRQRGKGKVASQFIPVLKEEENV